MNQIRGLVVCVNYDDLLLLTLPRNMGHLSSCLVVTHPDDDKTQQVAKAAGAQLLLTDAFQRNGAKFNKGLAIEEGLTQLGRGGWTLVWDADTLLPAKICWPTLEPGRLYGAARRMLENPKDWHADLDWSQLPVRNTPPFMGYCQLFHMSDKVLQFQPWYPVDWTHAGGCDTHFRNKWPRRHWTPLPFEVLHIGPTHANWAGRSSERRDDVAVPDAAVKKQQMQRIRQIHNTREYQPEERVQG